MSEVRHSRYTVMKDVLTEGIKHGQLRFTVTGDCMERSGICDGDIVAVDFTRYPHPPQRGDDGRLQHSACLCYGATPEHTRRPCLMVKLYTGKWGSRQLVGTDYANREGAEYRLNYSFEPIEIFGVVYAVWNADGALKWEIDVSGYPEALNTESTITGANVGEPMEIIRAADREKQRSKSEDRKIISFADYAMFVNSAAVTR